MANNYKRRILFDFITFNNKSGAGEYLRRVFLTLMEEYYSSVQLYALYDSQKGIAYEDLRPQKITYDSIEFVDLSNANIVEICNTYKIDTLFIGCVQYFEGYAGLSELKCKVVAVVHDLCGEEFLSSNMGDVLSLESLKRKYFLNHGEGFLAVIHNIPPTIKYIRMILGEMKNKAFGKRKSCLTVLNTIKDMLNVQLVAVSEYTRNSLLYFYNIPQERVIVLYSPERLFLDATDEVANEDLKRLIESKELYFLLVNANRITKNPDKAISAFKRFADIHKEFKLVTIGYPKSQFFNHINLPFLNDSDLCAAYKNCYALIYPSYFEGFGYPPLEAMKYKKPVLASNTTSMREILLDSPIWFSPIYDSDIFYALEKFNMQKYESLSELAYKRYEFIKKKQIRDLRFLVETIID